MSEKFLFSRDGVVDAEIIDESGVEVNKPIGGNGNDVEQSRPIQEKVVKVDSEFRKAVTDWVVKETPFGRVAINNVNKGGRLAMEWREGLERKHSKIEDKEERERAIEQELVELLKEDKRENAERDVQGFVNLLLDNFYRMLYGKDSAEYKSLFDDLWPRLGNSEVGDIIKYYFTAPGYLSRSEGQVVNEGSVLKMIDGFERSFALLKDSCKIFKNTPENFYLLRLRLYLMRNGIDSLELFAHNMRLSEGVEKKARNLGQTLREFIFQVIRVEVTNLDDIGSSVDVQHPQTVFGGSEIELGNLADAYNDADGLRHKLYDIKEKIDSFDRLRAITLEEFNKIAKELLEYEDSLAEVLPKIEEILEKSKSGDSPVKWIRVQDSGGGGLTFEQAILNQMKYIRDDIKMCRSAILYLRRNSLDSFNYDLR